MPKRVLLVGEYSQVASGYGVIQKNLCERFQAANYEVAELSAGVADGDPRLRSSPWKVYPAVPHPQNKRAQEVFHSHPLNKMGKHLFEAVCLDFLPHIVFCASDPFMAPQFISESSYRPFYKFACQAPVDGYPQHTDWLYLYKNVDALFTYTDWGADVLKTQMNNPNNLKGAAYLCADYNIFKPLNKQEVRNRLKVLNDVKIIGMVARNQPRKAFDELFHSFSKYLSLVSKELSNKSFLYLHTSYYDNTWDLEYLLNHYGLYSKVLFTYRCLKCGRFEPTFFAGARKICGCGGPLEMTSTHNGVSPEQMNLVYNLMDAYVQEHYLEGAGVPIIEAAACGLPLIVSDHAGTKDFIKNLGALPIDVKATRVETHTHRQWGTPDVDHAAQQIKSLMELPRSELASLGMQTRMLAQKLYNWDKTARIFLDYFDEVEDVSLWNQQPRFFQPKPNPPLDQFRNITQLVEWGILNIAGRPELLNSQLQHAWEKKLHKKIELIDGPNGPQVQHHTPESFFEYCRQIRTHWNNWEQQRARIN